MLVMIGLPVLPVLRALLLEGLVIGLPVVPALQQVLRSVSVLM